MIIPAATGGQGQKQEDKLGGCLLLIQMMKDGGLNQGDGSGDNEIYLDSEFIFFMVEPTSYTWLTLRF